MLFDHNNIKLETKIKKMSGKTQYLKNFLKKLLKRNLKETLNIRKYFKLNKNRNTTYENL